MTRNTKPCESNNAILWTGIKTQCSCFSVTIRSIQVMSIRKGRHKGKILPWHEHHLWCAGNGEHIWNQQGLIPTSFRNHPPSNSKSGHTHIHIYYLLFIQTWHLWICFECLCFYFLSCMENVSHSTTIFLVYLMIHIVGGCLWPRVTDKRWVRTNRDLKQLIILNSNLLT